MAGLTPELSRVGLSSIATDMDRLPVYILAGGKSSRFGSDKARALVGGTPLVARLATLAAPLSTRCTVVAATTRAYDDVGLRTIVDRHPGQGPMAGLDAALHDLDPSEPWLLLLSCDLVVFRPEWVSCLMAQRTAVCTAIAFRREHWEPLCALYHVSLRQRVADALEGGQLSLSSLLSRQGGIAVPFPTDWPDLVQVNTKGELDRFASSKPS